MFGATWANAGWPKEVIAPKHLCCLEPGHIYSRVPAYQNEEQHRKHIENIWANAVTYPGSIHGGTIYSEPERSEVFLPPLTSSVSAWVFHASLSFWPSKPQGTCPAELNCSATTAHGEVKSKRISIEEKVRRPHPPIQSLCNKEPLVSWLKPSAPENSTRKVQQPL